LWGDYQATPYSVLEAKSYSLPCVVTDVGDLPYMIRDGLDGYVVKRGDADMLAERLFLLLSNQDIMKKHGKSTREHVVLEYSSEKWYERMKDIYL
jgi:glycosyltransferase involved in cell wall biosynthesis